MNPIDRGESIVNSDAQGAFDRWLRLVQRRWWLRRLSEALVAGVVLAVLVTALAIGYMDWSLFDKTAVDNARRLVFWAVPLLALLPLLPRALRFMSRSAAARYLESRSRKLDALVISANQVSERARQTGQPVVSGSLAARLLSRATAACADCGTRSLEIPRLKRALTILVLTLIVAVGTAFFGSEAMRYGLALLFDPLSDPLAGSPYQLAVKPGDISVIEGEDQAVSALPQGFRPERVELLTRNPGETTWTIAEMNAGEDNRRHDALLFNLEGPHEYYVRSGSVESGRYLIDVVPRPRVSRIDLRYEFPPATGRAPELVEDGGAIRAVKGTKVEIRVLPNRPLETGQLVLNGSERIALQGSGNELRAEIRLEQDGHYLIELPAGNAGMTRASVEHPIQVFDDTRPSVSLVWPGRDARVTSIEEIGIALQAEDDVALQDLELVLNINGAEEHRVRFDTDPASPGTLSGQHLLALEEFSLQPGDLISYYARASDAVDNPARMVTTDLYFMDVRPFEQHFRRAQGGGGGGGRGGGGQSDAELTAQQRSLLVALFKLERDRVLIDETLFEQRVDTLKQAQARIRERLEAIVRRLGTRQLMTESQAHGQVAEELPRAAKAMFEMESNLAIPDLDNALPSARQALLHLQRADAAFRDVQIAEAHKNGGGASGSQAELANLFRLEMDKFRNQYAEMQRGRRNRPEHNLDQALMKLRELARRQQREVERTRMREQRGRSGTSGANSQQALAEEVKELMRELERLTRQRDQAIAEQARRSLEQLRTARREMQQAGRSGDMEQSRKALDRLRSVQRDLQRARPGGLNNGVDKAIRRSRAALEEQRNIIQQLNAEVQPDAPDRRRINDLVRRKRLLADEIGNLDGDIRRLHRQAQQERSPATGDLNDAGRMLEEQMLQERMLESARALRSDPRAHAAAEENELGRDLESIEEQLVQAGRTLQQQTEGVERQAALQRLRALVRNLKADQQRLAEAARRGSAADADLATNGRQASPSTGTSGMTNGSAKGGPAGPMGGYDRGYSIDASIIRQQTGERMREISTLKGDFTDIGEVAQDVEAVLQALNTSEINGSGTVDLQTLQVRQAQLLARLQRLEVALRESPENNSDGLIARRSAELSPRYQPLVDEYYRRLSEEVSVH